ncbi:hypothetical protein EVAR_83122_1 [Eumeta japonica]|uniref:Uncharacterized protein n=1 Tax=Eumeta variegata TaxID=151549 RepID=A0A4C1YCP0_EUMVA|nr:hypothetical protein EVAR_83122_1 [Eumeta japonica]
MLIKLELHGKTNSRKSTSNTTLKPAATTNNFKGTPPHHVPVLIIDNHIICRISRIGQNVPNQQQWHQHFKAQQQPAPIINKYDTDVTMRSRNTENTGNTGKGPQINIGRGRVVRELYNQEISRRRNSL